MSKGGQKSQRTRKKVTRKDIKAAADHLGDLIKKLVKRITEGDNEIKEFSASALKEIAQMDHGAHADELFKGRCIKPLVALLREGSANAQENAAAALAATAYCLYCSQSSLALESGPLCRSWIVGWPRSLHLGWVTAATLVNLNAWLGLAGVGPSKALAVVVMSHASAVWFAHQYAASGLPAASLAIAWALFAVGQGVPIGKDAVALGETAMVGLARAAEGAAAMAATLALARMVRSV